MIVISGASGFLGRHLMQALEQAGQDVHPLVRQAASASRPRAIRWNPDDGTLDANALGGADAVINLAGAPIAQRWTREHKRLILESRVRSTDLIARAMARAKPRPAMLLTGSAMGYYGDRGDELLDEDSPPGADFLADVAVAWERAADPARDAGIRVVALRIGLVLGRDGGALAKMLPPFRAGLGGPIGSGRQWMSWIAREDFTSAVLFLLEAPGATGAVNLVSPTAVRNADFARTLGRVLGRPALLPVPAFALRLALGEMAVCTLLASQRIRPKRLDELGFRWRFPLLAEALASALGRG